MVLSGMNPLLTRFMEEKNLNLWIPIIVLTILAVLAIFTPQIYRGIPKWFTLAAAAVIGWIAKLAITKGTDDIEDDADFNEAIKVAGYAYDELQDIFYSTMDAWQRKMGYCRLYDEAAAPMGMIIDCEPIYFDYEGKRWLIELWKGQYDLTTGAEIGIYTTEDPDIDIPEVFTGTFFQCAKDEDHLEMAYYLKKNGRKLFRREDKHWWLTGFKLGEFSEPSELIMYLTITLKNEEMRDAFIGGLNNAGYSEGEILVSGNTVGMIFDKPRTPQPISRTKETDKLIQMKNRFMCDEYQKITGPYETFPEKLKAVQKQSPELFDAIFSMGKANKMYDSYKKINPS